jgi:hypothetical protein
MSNSLFRQFPTRNPLISRKQIAKQLLQGCRIGQENATLLAQALCRVKPEMFEKDSAIQVKEFLILA